MKLSEIRPQVYAMAERAQAACRERFAEIDAVAEANTRRVMEAFQDMRVSDSCFAGTTGYGYDDLGRAFAAAGGRGGQAHRRAGDFAHRGAYVLHRRAGVPDSAVSGREAL